MDSFLKRQQNEKRFESWVESPQGGRKYWYEVTGHTGWKARYVKEVDENEQTLSFYQEIYDEQGKLVEIHHKYPIDKGHQEIEEG